MVEQGKCPQCGKAVPSDTPQGLCPACLLRRGLETNTIGDTGGAGGTRWTPPTVEQLAPLFPELDIIELIGRGGMGAVYKAREKQLDRLVALKILPPEIGRDDSLAKSFAKRFAHEAQAMAKLSHSNIVTIHSFGSRPLTAGGQRSAGELTAGGDLYFFIMEYVDGLSLRQLLDAGTVNPKEALAIVPQICDALQYAHDRGIVHRDIKPENILLNKAGQVKIADFGLAKLVGLTAGGAAGATAAGAGAGSPGAPGVTRRSPAQPDVTQAGERVMGTPQYMAPEQIDRPGEVDHRADIYSLGVVFYQMLTGELPVGRFEPPSRKVLIDVRLDEVVLRALEREPSRRYQQVSEVKTQVETIVGTQVPADTSQALSPDVRIIRIEPWHRAVAVVARRNGKAVVNWRAVRNDFLVAVGLLILWLALAYSKNPNLLRALPVVLVLWLAAFVSIVTIAIYIGLKRTPTESLIPLDSVPAKPASAAKGQDAHTASSPDNEDIPRRRFKSAATLVVVAAAVSAYFAAMAFSSGSQLLVIGVIIPLVAVLVILTILGIKSHKAQHRSDAPALPPATLEPSRSTPDSPTWPIAFSLAGLVWLAAWGYAIHLNDKPWKILADIVGFAAFQLVALALAIRLWRTPIGKVVAVASAVLAVGAMAFGSFVYLEGYKTVPLCPIEGLVTDTATGKPIAGAHVSDHVYGGSPSRPIKETWTDSDGYFILRTRFEEHMLAASAPGYETRLKLFSGGSPIINFNFALQPTTQATQPAPRVVQTAPTAVAVSADSVAPASSSGPQLLVIGVIIPLVAILVILTILGMKSHKARSRSDAAPQPGAGDAPGMSVDLEWNNRKRTLFLPLVAACDGRRVIYWPGVVLTSVITAALISAGAFLFDLILYRLAGVSIMGWPFAVIAVWGAIIVVGTGIRRAYKLPIERLTPLDSRPTPIDTTPQMGSARQAVNAPAWGLLVVSAIHLGFLAVAVYAGLSSVPSISPAHFAVPFILAYGLAILAGNAFTIYAAGRMRELKNYHEAAAACIIVMLLPLGSPIGLVFGIWALVVLSRRDVIAAFEAARAGQPTARRASLVPALWAIVIHAVVFGAILAVFLFVVPRFEALFRDMGSTLPQLTKATFAASHIACEWSFALFPMFLLLDAGVCLLLQYLAGQRARRWWSAILALAAAVVIATLGLGVGLQYARLTQAMVRSPGTPHPATQRAGSAAPTAARPETVTCPLEATIYELRLPPEKAGHLDAGALTSAAASPAGLAKALAGLGQVRLLYRMDQSVKLSGDQLEIKDRVPAVTESRRTETGSQINTVEYLSVGAVLEIAGTPLADGIDAKLDLEVIAMTGSQAKATTQPASVFRKARMSHKGLVRPGKAIVILSADAGSLDAEGRAVAYVARIVLGAPQAAAKPAAPVSAQSPACPLEATVYELHLPPERLGGLDAAALRSAAAGAASLEQALAGVGKAKLLYRMDQSVKLSGDRITINAEVPTVLGIRHTKTGQSIRTMQNHAVGAILNVTGTPQPDGCLSADLNLELSALTDSAVEIGPKLPARVVRKIVMAYRGPMKPGVPVVIVSADAVSPDAEGQAVAYVARIVLDKPAAASSNRGVSMSQPSTSPATGPVTQSPL